VNPDDTVIDTQSGIMDLWFGVIHAAKKSIWDDETDHGQQDLLHLLQTFKNRPDPDITEDLFPKRTGDWLYSWTGGKLWSELSLIGMALRESLDDGRIGQTDARGPGYRLISTSPLSRHA
jgi:hypothetical protein